MVFALDRSAGRTGGVGSAEQTDAQRRITNLIRYGKVAEIDPPNGRIKVRIGAPTDPNGHVVTTWIPWLSGRAGKDRQFWSPEPGEAVVLFSPGGDLSTAIAAPGAFSTDHPAPGDRETLHRIEYADGAVVEYDREAHAHTIQIPPDGTATVRVGGSTVVTAKDAITLTCGGSSLRITPDGIFLEGPTIAMAAGGGAGAATLAGNFEMKGALAVDGSVAASGTIIDAGGNSNHHTH